MNIVRLAVGWAVDPCPLMTGRVVACRRGANGGPGGDEGCRERERESVCVPVPVSCSVAEHDAQRYRGGAMRANGRPRAVTGASLLGPQSPGYVRWVGSGTYAARSRLPPPAAAAAAAAATVVLCVLRACPVVLLLGSRLSTHLPSPPLLFSISYT
ncbi:hypothetical protein BKA81DRAFT_425523 [Phyllosticta paracitricarpa]